MLFGSGARRRQKAGRGSWDRPLGGDVLRLEAHPLGGDVPLLVVRLAHLHAGLRGLRALRVRVAHLPNSDLILYDITAS